MSCAWAAGPSGTSGRRCRRRRPHIITICGDTRRGGPGVHHVGIADEAARQAALLRGVARRHVGGRIDRQLRLVRHHRRVEVDAAVLAHGIPHRERHAEEALAADAPVAVQAVDPVLVPRAHVLRVPLQLAAALEQLLAELDGPDEPLPAGDDLERAVALLVELHRVGDRPRLALQVAARLQQLDDLRLRLLGREPRELVVAPAARGRRPWTPTPARPTSPGRACRSAGRWRAPAASARATRSRR